MGKRGAGGLTHFVVRGTGFAVANIFHRAGGKNHRILRHDANDVAQIAQRHVTSGDAIERDAATVRIIKAQQQLEHGALARAAGANDGHRFSWRYRQDEIT